MKITAEMCRVTIRVPGQGRISLICPTESYASSLVQTLRQSFQNVDYIYLTEERVRDVRIDGCMRLAA